jgi:hypothetical protein
VFLLSIKNSSICSKFKKFKRIYITY